MILYLVVANALKRGACPSGTVNWNLQLSVSDSHANIESSLKHVMIVLLNGKKRTWKRYWTIATPSKLKYYSLFIAYTQNIREKCKVHIIP